METTPQTVTVQRPPAAEPGILLAYTNPDGTHGTIRAVVVDLTGREG